MNRLSGFAYLPGTGPSHLRCADCLHLRDMRNNYGRCAEAARLRNLPVSKMEKITAGSLACKYVKARS